MSFKFNEEFCIGNQSSILETLKQMDQKGHKSLLAFEDDKFYSMITIGDLQRAIISGIEMSTPIKSIIDKSTKSYARPNENIENIRKMMMRIRSEFMPVVDSDGSLIKVYAWTDLFADLKIEDSVETRKLALPVVIMAGGTGSRLQPLTNIYPKPLIPVGEKTIIETIMDKFVSFGCIDFHLSVNYKADTIKNYFDLLDNPNYSLHYFQEDKPMGTAGSLRLLKDKINTTFFVSNCDILINEDYAAILDYHRKNKNELTVVAALKTYSIPYGTINTGENGLLESIEEKPDLTFKINTGLYILEPSLLYDIPDDFFHITHLMEKLKKENRRVGVYPISQNDWQDMGDWNEYLRMINIR